MKKTGVCLHCGTIFTWPPKARKKKFCKEKCRYDYWVTHNRNKLNAAVRKYRAKRYQEDGLWLDHSPKSSALKQWMIEIKSQPCQDCSGTFEICCMDFDHRPGTVKSYNIGSMFAHHYSRELIEEELKKCDLVCANCHRVRTRNKRRGSGLSGISENTLVNK